MTTATRNDIAPVDYSRESNEFVFTLEDYILRVNYNKKTFQLITPENIAYDEAFDFMEEPADWFQIDYNIEEWIRKALKWNRPRIKVDNYNLHEINIGGRKFTVGHNPKNQDLVIHIPEQVVITTYQSIMEEEPELEFLKYIDHGELITQVTNHVFTEMQGLDILDRANKRVDSPLTFNPKKIETSQNTYEYDLVEQRVVYIRIADRKLHTNILTMELGAPELALYDQNVYENIRNMVAEKGIS